MMRQVKLYGHLGKKFGKLFEFDVQSVAEAIRALKANIPGFERYLIAHRQSGFHVLVGRRDLGKDELSDPCGRGDIKIIPALQGAKRAGVFQTILGAILVVVGVFSSTYGGSGMISVGLSMMAGGIAQMLARTPVNSRGDNEATNMPSYVFNGPVNTTSQGNPVPVCYGEMIVGSQVASFGITTAQIMSGGPTDGTVLPDNGLPPPGTPDGNGGINDGTMDFGVVEVRRANERDWDSDGQMRYYWIIGLAAASSFLRNGFSYAVQWTSPADSSLQQFTLVFNDGFYLHLNDVATEHLPRVADTMNVSTPLGGGYPASTS